MFCRFADGKIMASYVNLLKSFENNGAQVNHCIVKMLHRVAYDLKMYGLLFQSSLFRIFQQVKTLVGFHFVNLFRKEENLQKWYVAPSSANLISDL